MENKKRCGLVARTEDQFNKLKEKYKAYFEYYDVIWIPLDDIKNGYTIDRITMDEFRSIL